MSGAVKPVVSVVIEGYNEYLSFDEIDTLTGLRAQDFPLDRVEVVLIGSAAQVDRWTEQFARGSPFLRVKAVAADDTWYFKLKNQGAKEASADIVALTDSDAAPDPGWLSAIVEAIEGGADVVAGVSLFRSRGRGPDHPLMQVAACITWAPRLGISLRTQSGDGGFLSHNVAFRTSVLRGHPFRTDLREKVAGVFLLAALEKAGVSLAFHPAQRVAHSFSSGWWIRLHARFGYEMYLLRRLHAGWPHRWMRKTWILEPPMTAAWYAFLDVPRWFVYGRHMEVGSARRLALLPLLLAMSVVARTAEMAGMYATMVAPQRMKRFAASV